MQQSQAVSWHRMDGYVSGLEMTGRFGDWQMSLVKR